MSDQQSPDKKAPLSTEENAQLLHLVRDCSDNLRYAKTQQWRAGHLTILTYAALIGTAYGIFGKDHFLAATTSKVLSNVLSSLVVLTGAAGIVVVWNLQRWMSHLRGSLSAAEKHFGDIYNTIASPLHGGQNYASVLYKSEQTWLITFVIVLGGVLAWCVAVGVSGSQ